MTLALDLDEPERQARDLQVVRANGLAMQKPPPERQRPGQCLAAVNLQALRCRGIGHKRWPVGI